MPFQANRMLIYGWHLCSLLRLAAEPSGCQSAHFLTAAHRLRLYMLGEPFPAPINSHYIPTPLLRLYHQCGLHHHTGSQNLHPQQSDQTAPPTLRCPAATWGNQLLSNPPVHCCYLIGIWSQWLVANTVPFLPHPHCSCHCCRH